MEGKLRTLIVDDEHSSRRAIEMQLEAMEEVEIIGQAASGAAAVTMIREMSPDLVFLDVQMPTLDGFQVLEELGPENLPQIVFVTGHDAYAVRAFDVSATDYLLKPVDDRQLRRAIDRVRLALVGQDPLDDLFRLMEHLDQDARLNPSVYKTRLLVKEKGEYFFLPVQEVDWIEAEGNYVRVHLAAGTHLMRASMNDLEAGLDPRHFLRVHRGAIVNLNSVKAIRPDGPSDYSIVLRSGERVRVGRTYRDSLLQRPS